MRWLSILLCLAAIPALGGGALHFNNAGGNTSNNSVRLEFDAQVTKDTTHTLALWWFPTFEDESGPSLPRFKDILGYGDNFDIRADDDSANAYVCSVNGGNTTTILAYSSAEVNQWYFFACSVDGTNLTTYYGDPSAANRNLQQGGQTAFSSDIPDTNSGAYGGYHSSLTTNADFMPDGYGAYVQEWNRGLTMEELQTAMLTPGCVRRGLVRYHPSTDVVENDGDPAYDGGIEEDGATAQINAGNGVDVSEVWEGPPIRGRCR